MDAHSSLELLFDESDGPEMDLPPAVGDVYGSMRLPRKRPYIISNFVATIDGVVALDVAGGSPRLIGGGDFEDRLIMACCVPWRM